MGRICAFFFLARLMLGGTAADLSRAISENSFDPAECYRVRDVTLAKEDLRFYFTDGHLIFAKPVAGRRVAALFVADTSGGDGEVILLPPDRAERRSLAGYTDSPNLDEHFKSALLLFSGDVYEKIIAQFTPDSTNRKSPESAPQLQELWTPALRGMGASYQTRLTLDLLGGQTRRADLFVAVLSNQKHGFFSLLYDPERAEQLLAGQFATRGGALYFDTWASFQARSFRNDPGLLKPFATVSDYRIDATIGPDLLLTADTRVKVKPAMDNTAAVPFDLTPDMSISAVTVDGEGAEVLQDQVPQSSAVRDGNALVVVVPREPLRLGREYDFEFHHSGKVIQDSGGRVLFVRSRVNWYPVLGSQFSTYDLTFRYPRDLDLVASGSVIEDRQEGAQRITRRLTSSPVPAAGFNLGSYDQAVVTIGPYQVEVCANRALEPALQPKPQPLLDLQAAGIAARIPADPMGALARPSLEAVPDRLHEMAGELASALEFMSGKFGPPALPRITVSPIPGEFGEGMPGLIYLSTMSYMKLVPGERPGNQETGLVLRSLLQTHELAHQWWGNRVTVRSDHDVWLMEALANYSALLYIEKSKGRQAMETILASYRDALLEKSGNGQTVESSGPIVLGSRLKNSVEPRGYHDIVYGKGSWIMQMLRERMGGPAFFSMLAEITRRYDRRQIGTDEFRQLAAKFLPPGSEDPQLETFFDQWVYGTGIPTLTMNYTVGGAAPSVKVSGTVVQSGVEDRFETAAPVEIQVSRAHTITKWVRVEDGTGKFTVTLQQPPLKVTLDPHNAVLRK